MRKKFVQITVLVLLFALLIPYAVCAAGEADGASTYITAQAVDGSICSIWVAINADGTYTVLQDGLYVDFRGNTYGAGDIVALNPDGSVILNSGGSGGSVPDGGSAGGEGQDPGGESGDPSGGVVVPGGSQLPGSSRIMRIGIYYGTAGKNTVDLSLTTGNGFQFGYYDSANQNTFVPLSGTERTKITVTAAQGTMIVTDTSTGELLYQHSGTNGTQLGIQPYSVTGEKTVTKCGYPYYGGFRFECIAAYDGTMTIVNMVPLEDYVTGVAPYEMSPSWHVEALKAQVVCARTFALSHISKHGKTFSFDLCDGDCCQVYKGVYSGSYISTLNEAVASTAGVVLMYDGDYCDTVYSSSNGGGSEGSKNVWGKDIPYLQGVIDPYEATIADTIKNYYWSETFTGEELQAKLIASGRVSCGVVTEVRTTLSETGNVIALTFLDNNGKSWTIYNTERGGSKCRTFLSLRSIHYTVSSETGSQTMKEGQVLVNGGELLDISGGITVISGDGTLTTIYEGSILTDQGVEDLTTDSAGGVNSASGHVFTFSGSGWGHNVGMSQYGALAMAKLGFTYGQILEFYYTGAMIVSC